jgi:hypothetical protein
MSGIRERDIPTRSLCRDLANDSWTALIESLSEIELAYEIAGGQSDNRWLEIQRAFQVTLLHRTLGAAPHWRLLHLRKNPPYLPSLQEYQSCLFMSLCKHY